MAVFSSVLFMPFYRPNN